MYFYSNLVPKSFSLSIIKTGLWKIISKFSFRLLNEMIMSSMDSSLGIRTTLEAPYNNKAKLNILRPAVLRQYFGQLHHLNENLDNYEVRYTYGGGSGSACNSVGGDKNSLCTRRFTKEIDIIAKVVHNYIFSNKDCQKYLYNNRRHSSEIRSDEFNHCTVLYYYGVDGIKEYSKLGFHCDCVFDKHGNFRNSANSQVENSVTVSVCIGDDRKIRFKRRYIHHPREKWIYENDTIMETVLGNGSLLVIHPDDERPFYIDKDGHTTINQIQHGDTIVKKGNFSLSLVFRTVSNKQLYRKSHDTIVTGENKMIGNKVIDEKKVLQVHQNLKSQFIDSLHSYFV